MRPGNDPSEFPRLSGSRGYCHCSFGQSGSGKEASAAVIKSGEALEINLQINGHAHRLLVEPRWSLLHVLREELGFTGLKRAASAVSAVPALY